MDRNVHLFLWFWLL